MAKKPAKDMDFGFNSVQIEDELTSLQMNVDVETPVVTSFSDTGPRRVEGNYDWNFSLEGGFDGASGQGDATIFGQIGSGAATVDFEPTGAVAATDDPNYDGSAMVGSYQISGSVGGAVTYSAELRGHTALTRAVT